MKVIIGEHAGFCKGVERAVRLATDGYKGSRCVLGSLVHNADVINRLKKSGIAFENTPSQLYEEYVISAHGISAEHAELLDSKKIIDATCPVVARLIEISKKIADDELFLLVGDVKHIETVNVLSYAKNRIALPVDRIDVEIVKGIDASRYDKIVLTFQTTIDKSIALRYVELCKRVFGEKLRISDTLCPTVEKRISEATSIASKVQLMIVVGDKKSSNCNTLYNKCKEINSNTIFAEKPSDVDVSGYDVVGLTAGASVPKSQIDSIMLKING